MTQPTEDDIEKSTRLIGWECKQKNLNCNGQLSSCDYLNHFVVIIKHFGHNKNINSNLPNLSHIDISSLFNCHGHLIFQHGTDEDYETIHNKLKVINNCSINKCSSFNRNNRNRILKNSDEIYENIEKDVIYKQQIIDLIHCDYFHSFEIGFKLKLNDKIKYWDDRNKLIKHLREKYKSIRNKLRLSDVSKFKTTKPKQEAKQTEQNNDLKMFDYGVSYIYNASDVHEEYELIYLVKPKYQSIKEEILNNGLALGQFHNELKKSEIYFNSNYLKNILIDINEHSIILNHILSIVIYTNFTQYQHEFSKTYRNIFAHETAQSITKRHGNYYHQGKCLKEVVHQLGVEMNDKRYKVETLYHGISDNLMFNIYTNGHGNMKYYTDQYIHVPLSTSSQFAVAVNFTFNDGVVVEFTDSRGVGNKVSKCFGVAWCSDFGNESEYLFIQGCWLSIHNIVETNSGCEYKPILESIALLTNVYSKSEYVADENHEQILIKLIKNELNMEKWNSLKDYAKKLFHQYCVNRSESIFIDREQISKHSKHFYNFIKSSEYEGVNIQILKKLHMNVGIIWLYGYDMFDSMDPLMEDILHLARQDEIQYTEFMINLEDGTFDLVSYAKYYELLLEYFVRVDIQFYGGEKFIQVEKF
eukprot:223813_1